MIHITSVVSNDIVTDNRIHKIALSLEENGYKLSVVGRRRRNSAAITDRPYQVRRFKLLFNTGPLFYVNLNIRLLLYLLNAKVDIILSNDLDTLPACHLAARIRKKELFFDSHELFSEVPELVDRPRIRKIWQALENYLVRKVENGFTVCDSIAEHYKELYNTNFEVIRNVGKFRYDYEFNVPKDGSPKLIIYQGALNYGRGLEMLIKSMQFLNGHQLWIVGTGDIEKKLKRLSSRLKLSDRIKFVGRMPLGELWNYTSKAGMGVSLEEDLGLNYQYALPNKLFDYIQARIPVVVSDLPEMRSIVTQYRIGKVLSKNEPEVLAATIREVLESESTTEKYKINLELAARELCWEREEEKLIKLFKRVSSPSWAENA